MIVISEFEYHSFILLKFLVLFVDLADCDTNNIDHVPKNSCSHHLNKSNYDDFSIIAWSEIPITDGNHCCVSPVIGVYVEFIPRRTLKAGFSDPGL